DDLITYRSCSTSMCEPYHLTIQLLDLGGPTALEVLDRAGLSPCIDRHELRHHSRKHPIGEAHHGSHAARSQRSHTGGTYAPAPHDVNAFSEALCETPASRSRLKHSSNTKACRTTHPVVQIEEQFARHCPLD